MAIIDRNAAITFSKAKLCRDIADLSCREAFDPNKDYEQEWNVVLLRYMTTAMIEETDGITLSAEERQCVLNFISGTLN